MAKVNIKSDKITPFGGIYYASKAFYALSLDKVINDTLGVRSSTYNGYQWDERYTYRCIITNDWDSEEKCVIETYNKRGARESDFDHLNNDFGGSICHAPS